MSLTFKTKNLCELILQYKKFYQICTPEGYTKIFNLSALNVLVWKFFLSRYLFEVGLWLLLPNFNQKKKKNPKKSW